MTLKCDEPLSNVGFKFNLRRFATQQFSVYSQYHGFAHMHEAGPFARTLAPITAPVETPKPGHHGDLALIGRERSTGLIRGLCEGYPDSQKKTVFGAAKVFARTSFCVPVIFTEPRSVVIGSS
jgi:hypothetical protein